MTDSAPASRPKAYSYLRMSTDKQLQGDSLRRQLKKSREYAERHGLDLVDSDELKDIGLSGFTGENIAKGVLGIFLNNAEEGKIESGSYLLVEAFDRLSRQNIKQAMRLFMRITEIGINLVTLDDEEIYTKNDTDILKFMAPIIKMGLAHQESVNKSNRGIAVWGNKRANASFRKITARCPAWLRLSDCKTKFEILPEKVEIVRRIFEEFVSGIGAYSIVRRLNEEKIAALGFGGTWQKSSIDKILKNPAVIGLFQPHKRVDGLSQPVGEPIQGYFPTIIDEDLYFRAQSSRASRLRKGAGRRGLRISNLFSGLATCGYCHTKMHYVNKGAPPKGGSFLVCDAANRNAGCTRAAWRYDNFETSFLTFVEELDLEPLAHDSEASAKRSVLDATIQSLRGRKAALEVKRDNIFEALAAAEGALQFLTDKLNVLSTEISSMENELSVRIGERDALQEEASRFYESREQIKALIHKLQGADGPDVYKLRAQVASRLKAIFSTIHVHGRGKLPEIERMTAFLRDAGDALHVHELMETFKAEVADPKNHRPYFSVMLKDRRIRTVTPAQDDPTKVHEQILRTENEVRVLNGDLDTIFERPFRKKMVEHELANFIAQAEASERDAEPE